MSRRVLRISSIINSKQRDIFNRYVPGSGVGACNTSVRRAKLIKATRTSADPLLQSSQSPSLPSLPSPFPPPPPSLCGSIEFKNTPDATSLEYPNDDSFIINSADFTIEWWQYFTGEADYGRVFSIGSYATNDIKIALSYEENVYFWYPGTENSSVIVLYGQPPKNTWAHIAIVGSSGNEIKFYVNGNEESATTLSYNFTEGSLPLTIGNENIPISSSNFTGKITNFRWVVGTQVYTSNFVPPTDPLTNIPGTKLLLLVEGESNVFDDSSNYNKTPTNNGASYSTLTPVTCSPAIGIITSKNNTASYGYTIGGETVLKDMDNDLYYIQFNPSDYSDLFPNMAELIDENVVEGYKDPEERLVVSFWRNFGNDIFDIWGKFYIYDIQIGKYYFPILAPQNQEDGVITEQTFIAFGGRTFVIKHGWPVNGIFKFDISVSDNIPFRFGCYGDMGTDGNEYVESLTYDYTLGGNNLKLYYHLDKNENNNIQTLYSYWIPTKVSENNSIQSYNIYYNGDYMSAISKPVTKGLIVYFSLVNNVKEWVVNDLALE